MENYRLREMLLEVTDQKDKLERMYLKKSGADAEKAEQIRRMHAEFDQEKQKLLREGRLDMSKELTAAKHRTTEVHTLQKEISELRRKLDIAESDKIDLKDKLAMVKKADSWSKRTPTRSMDGIGLYSFFVLSLSFAFPSWSVYAAFVGLVATLQ